MTAEYGAEVEHPRAPAAIADRLLPVARRHALFLALLLAGIALRVVTQFAYRPAILYIDSYRYLLNAAELDPTRNQPLGYTLFIRPLLFHFDTLALLPALNHVMGVVMACLIYAVLLRRGAWRWLAALAAAPVLLDAYQLQIEQMIMSDTFFQLVLVAAFTLLVWWRRPGLLAAGGVGLLLGFGVWVRLIGEPLIIPAVIYLLAVSRPWWRRFLTAGVCAAVFATPLLSYAAWHAQADGKFHLNYQTNYVLYARVAPIVDCTTLRMPAYERPLCPDLPPEQRPNEDWYFWQGPERSYQPPPGKTTEQVLHDFFMRVVKQQPLAVARVVLWDYVKSFAWEKRTIGNDLPVSRWRFQVHYPVYERADLVNAAVAEWGGYGPTADESLTRFLRGYQLSVGYTPGPFLFAAVAAAVLATLGVGRAPTSGLRAASLTWAMAGVGVVLASDLYEFSWRYQLPALVLLPVAGVLGVTALLRRPPPEPDPAAEEQQPTGHPRDRSRPPGTGQGPWADGPRSRSGTGASRSPASRPVE